ncbi:MAG: PilZ domain-containing protein [Gammaproteobacteria bacterium]|nr:PilZ domain-containing protein [Gammaproteobacteria bacterium]
MTQSNISQLEAERRRGYRVDDRIGLRVSLVPSKAEQAALNSANAARERFAMINKLLVSREKALPAFRKIERRAPDVAKYLRHLEKQIETVARVLGQSGNALPGEPTDDVNISATGLSFVSESAYPVDALLELRMVLFPEQVHLFLYGRVVRVDTELDLDLPTVSVAFDGISDEDSELLIKHLHNVQMRALNTET